MFNAQMFSCPQKQHTVQQWHWLAGADVWRMWHVLAISVSSILLPCSHIPLYLGQTDHFGQHLKMSHCKLSLYVFIFCSPTPVLIISADFALSKQNKRMYASVITCHPFISYHSVSRERFWTNKEVGLIFRDQEKTFIIDMSGKTSFRFSSFPNIKADRHYNPINQKEGGKKATLDSLKKIKSTVIAAEPFLTDGTLAVSQIRCKKKVHLL